MHKSIERLVVSDVGSQKFNCQRNIVVGSSRVDSWLNQRNRKPPPVNGPNKWRLNNRPEGTSLRPFAPSMTVGVVSDTEADSTTAFPTIDTKPGQEIGSRNTLSRRDQFCQFRADSNPIRVSRLHEMRTFLAM